MEQPRKRIAVLFTGRVKGFKDAYESIQEHIFKGHDVDVFLSHNAANTNYDLDEFLTLYNVKRHTNITIQLPSDFNDLHILNRSNNKVTVYYMFVCWYDAYCLMETYATEHNINYDYVIYMRADMFFNSNLTLNPALGYSDICIPSLQDYCGICDQFSYGRPEAMKKVMQLVKHIKKYNALVNYELNPEGVLMFHLLNLKMIIHRFPLQGELIPSRLS